VVVSTASPYKFSRDVLTGIAGPERSASLDAFSCSEELEQLSGVPMPAQVRGLRNLPIRHRAECEVGEMGEAVLHAFDS
jgi:threonine synthase